MSDFQTFLDEKLSSVSLNKNDAIADEPEDYDIFREIRDMITALRHDRI